MACSSSTATASRRSASSPPVWAHTGCIRVATERDSTSPTVGRTRSAASRTGGAVSPSLTSPPGASWLRGQSPAGEAPTWATSAWMERSCGCQAATTTWSTRSTPPRERCGASRWARSPTASRCGRSLAATRSATPATCASRLPIRGHLLRWRPRPQAQRTESTPRLRSSGAASHLTPSRQPASLGGEAVADARLSQEIARARGLGFELVTQVGHVDADVVRLVGMRRAPHLAEQLLVRHDLSRVPDERREELVLGRCQAHLGAAERDVTAQPIDLQLTHLERRFVGLVGGASGV